MAIQGAQVSMYTKHTVFVFFLLFFFTQNTLIFFVSMALQGTQVSMYTKHTVFSFFLVLHLAMLISIYKSELE